MTPTVFVSDAGVYRGSGGQKYDLQRVLALLVEQGLPEDRAANFPDGGVTIIRSLTPWEQLDQVVCRLYPGARRTQACVYNNRLWDGHDETTLRPLAIQSLREELGEGVSIEVFGDSDGIVVAGDEIHWGVVGVAVEAAIQGTLI